MARGPSPSVDAQPIPSLAQLRMDARKMRERRDPTSWKGTGHDTLSSIIRERTKLTLKAAMNVDTPDSGANTKAPRDGELRHLQMRLQDLQRTFNILHADLVTKEAAKRKLEQLMALNSLGTSPHDGSSATPRPTPPSGKPPANRRRPHTATGTSLLERETNEGSSDRPFTAQDSASRISLVSPPNSPGGESSMMSNDFGKRLVGFADTSTVSIDFGKRSLTDVAKQGPTPAALGEMTERVNKAFETLGLTLRDGESYAYMEHRQSELNRKLGGQVDELRDEIGVVEKDNAKLRAAEEEAQQEAWLAMRQLYDARAALTDEQHSYEDIKTQRVQGNEDKDAIEKREMAFAETKLNARLDGDGELTAEGEAKLMQEATEMDAKALLAKMERDKTSAEEHQLEEKFETIRRAMHDPDAIQTPNDLVDAILSAGEKTEELRDLGSAGEERQSALTEENDSLEKELKELETTAATARQEGFNQLDRQFEALEQRNMRAESKWHRVRDVMNEAKLRLTCLAHMAPGGKEAYDNSPKAGKKREGPDGARATDFIHLLDFVETSYEKLIGVCHAAEKMNSRHPSSKDVFVPIPASAPLV